MTVLTIKAVNKDTKNKRKFCRQSCSKYFDGWANEEWLLVINWCVLNASQDTKQLKTYDLKNLINISKTSELRRAIS